MTDFIYGHEASIRLSIFLSGFLLFALWELIWPKRVLTENKLRRWFCNLSLIATGTLVVRVLVPMAAVGAAYFAEKNHIGFANHVDLPLWLEVIVVFVLLDLAIYFQHTMFHVLPIMWRFHRVHHSDLDCDISTGLRFHPIEILVSIIIKIVLVVSWGAPVLAVIAFEIVLNFMSMFSHSNIFLNEKFEHILRWFIVTPDMHRVHHSVQENETNSNFGFHISIWDRLFGTYKAEPEAGQLGMTIGLDRFRKGKNQNFTSLITMPFSSKIRGYAINYRDTKNSKKLAYAKEIAREHKEKAKLAKELDGYLQAIGEYALVSVADSEGTIIDANEKFCEVSGYSREELLGQNHRVVNSGVHDDKFFDELWQTISSGENWHGEVCNRAKDGHFYWVDSAIVPIKNSEGEIEEYVSARVDVSQRKRYELGIEKVNKALTSANMELETLSRIDALTGIANRRHFDESLDSYISAMSRPDASLTLMLCDVDHFKNYKYHYGHQACDDCLRNIAEAIESNFTRAGDIVARYGGEEFAVILPNVGRQTSMMLAERLRASIESLALEHNDSSVSKVVTVSIGVVYQQNDEQMMAGRIIEKADKALYSAKEIGRNRVEVIS